MRVIDVPELGYPAAIVDIDEERVLLLNSALTENQRVGAMLDAMQDLDA